MRILSPIYPGFKELKMEKELGTLTLNIKQEALKSIIASGRLLELAGKVAAEAAAQISSQLVDHVASAALQNEGFKAGVSANVSFIFEGGDFGTVPPRPHWGVVNLETVAETALRQIATAGGER
jgi:hypothetical protein